LNDRLDQERMIAEKSRASGTEGKVHSISWTFTKTRLRSQPCQ